MIYVCRVHVLSINTLWTMKPPSTTTRSLARWNNSRCVSGRDLWNTTAIMFCLLTQVSIIFFLINHCDAKRWKVRKIFMVHLMKKIWQKIENLIGFKCCKRLANNFSFHLVFLHFRNQNIDTGFSSCSLIIFINHIYDDSRWRYLKVMWTRAAVNKLLLEAKFIYSSNK